MTLPTLTLDAVLGGGPLTDLTTASWTTLPKPGAGSAITGPSRSRETDRFQNGRQTYKVPNSDRHFDPTAAAPLLTSFTPVRVRATSGATTYPVAVGYVDEETPDWVLISDDFASIACIDALSYLAGKSIIDAGYAGEVLGDIPIAYWRLADLQGDTTFDDLAGSHPLTWRALPYGVGVAVISGGPDQIVWQASPNIQVSKDAAVALRGSVIQCPAGTGSFFTGDFKLEMWINMTFAAPPAYLWAYCNGATVAASTYFIGAIVNPDGTVNVTCSDIGAGHTLAVNTTIAIDTLGPHHLVFGQTGHTLTIHVDGLPAGSGTLATIPTPIGPGTFTLGSTAPNQINFDQQVVFDEVAYYTTLSDAQIAAHHALGATPWAGDLSGARINRLLDIVGWPAAMRTIDPGRSIIVAPTLDTFSSPLNIASYLQQVAEAEGGRLFAGPDGFIVFHDRARPLRPPNTTSQATFSDIDPATRLLPGGALPYATGGLKGSRSTAEVANEVSITRAPAFTGDTPITQLVEDATSQNLLKAVRTFSQDGQLNPTDQECQNKARIILNNRKTPAFRIHALTIDGRASDALWPVVLGLKVGDLITVMRHPPGGGAAYTAQLRIEGKHPKITKRGLLFDLVCSVADTTDYMTIGHALGGRLFW